MKIKICCLPVAGIGNPYQYLMMKGLNSNSKIIAESGDKSKIFGIIKTAIKFKPNYIHFDWESCYYYRRWTVLTILLLPLFFLQIIIVKYLMGIRLVWTPHNLFPHNAKFPALHRFCRRFFASQMSWIRLFSNITIERAAKEFNVPKEKLIIVPEGSYVDYYPNFVNTKNAREFLNISGNLKVFLYLGMIRPYKGIQKLISSFNRINDTNSVLIIAGKVIDQNYANKIKSLVSERIKVVDKFIPEDELQYYFNAADIVVLPFDNVENSGSAILAMGFKKPIIAPKMGVLVDRLSKQLELLYSENIEVSFNKIYSLSTEQLEEYGRLNFLEVEKYSWNAFSNYFD